MDQDQTELGISERSLQVLAEFGHSFLDFLVKFRKVLAFSESQLKFLQSHTLRKSCFACFLLNGIRWSFRLWKNGTRPPKIPALLCPLLVCFAPTLPVPLPLRFRSSISSYSSLLFQFVIFRNFLVASSLASTFFVQSFFLYSFSFRFFFFSLSACSQLLLLVFHVFDWTRHPNYLFIQTEHNTRFLQINLWKNKA